MLNDNKYRYSFSNCRGVPNSSDSELLGVAVCMGARGCFYSQPLFLQPCWAAKPQEKDKISYSRKKTHSNKGKDSVNLKGNVFPCLFGYVSLPKVVSSVLRDKVFTLIFEKLFHSLVDVTARRCSLLLSVNNTF